MLKWDVYGVEEESFCLPRTFTIMLICLYTGAFSFVAYLWYSLLVFLLQNRQTFMYWLSA